MALDNIYQRVLSRVTCHGTLQQHKIIFINPLEIHIRIVKAEWLWSVTNETCAARTESTESQRGYLDNGLQQQWTIVCTTRQYLTLNIHIQKNVWLSYLFVLWDRILSRSYPQQIKYYGDPDTRE